MQNNSLVSSSEKALRPFLLHPPNSSLLSKNNLRSIQCTQSPVQFYRVFPGGKERPGRDADPSPPSSAVVLKE